MKTTGLTKRERIKKTQEFTTVRNLGNYIKGENLALGFYRNALKTNRIGVKIYTRKLLAYQRNRVKRVLRESYRTNKAHFKEGFDIVVYFIGTYAGISTVTVSKELLTLSKKAGLLQI